MNLNKPLRFFWTLLWKLVTPVLLSFITVLAWVNHEPMAYEDYEFPAGIEAMGWIMELLPLLIVLLYPIIPLRRAYNEGQSAPYITDFFQNTSAVCLGTSDKFGGIADAIYHVLAQVLKMGKFVNKFSFDFIALSTLIN